MDYLLYKLICIKSYGYEQEHELFYAVYLLDDDDVQCRKACNVLHNDEIFEFDPLCRLFEPKLVFAIL